MLRRSFTFSPLQACRKHLKLSVSSFSLIASNACSTFRLQSSSSSSGGCPFSGSSQTQQSPASEEKQTLAAKACPFSGANKQPAESCPESGGPTADTPKPTDFRSVVNQLGKSRLSAFVTSTATAGYVLCGGTSVVTGTLVTLGTYLQSLSANTSNQCIEIEHDAKMKRTMFRPLVTGVISLPAAMAVAATELAVGTAMLSYCMTSSTATVASAGLLSSAVASVTSLALTPIGQAVALLGVVNWILYVCMYTPLKRVSATNTWFGAIVGAIPPLMGGVAALSTTSSLPLSLPLSYSTFTSLLLSPQLAPAYLLAVIMFAWQIPHFMSLSFHCRRDYENAGYKMLAFSNPVRASAYAVLLSVIMAIFCVPCVHWFMPVEPWYYVLATLANGTMIFKSIRFFNDPKKYCRSCFVFSYIFLSLMLAMLCLNHAQPVTRVQNALKSRGYLSSESDDDETQVTKHETA